MEQEAMVGKTIHRHHPKGIMREAEMIVTAAAIIKAMVEVVTIIMAAQVAEVVEDITDTEVTLIETTAEVEAVTSW